MYHIICAHHRLESRNGKNIFSGIFTDGIYWHNRIRHATTEQYDNWKGPYFPFDNVNKMK